MLVNGHIYMCGLGASPFYPASYLDHDVSITCLRRTFASLGYKNGISSRYTSIILRDLQKLLSSLYGEKRCRDIIESSPAGTSAKLKLKLKLKPDSTHTSDTRNPTRILGSKNSTLEVNSTHLQSIHEEVGAQARL